MAVTRAGMLGVALLLIAACLGAGAPAKAQIRTDELARLCSGEAMPRETAVALCRMYISGLSDMHFHVVYEIGQRFFCLKEDSVTTDEVARRFVAWVEQNPSERHQSARYTMIRAMAEAYPCK